MIRATLVTIAALVLAALVITLLIWLVHVVVAYFSADRAALRQSKHEVEDAIDELERAKRRRSK